MPVLSLNPIDLAIRVPSGSTTIPSPPQPCRVRYPGLSRYRNDPYNCSVVGQQQNQSQSTSKTNLNQGSIGSLAGSVGSVSGGFVTHLNNAPTPIQAPNRLPSLHAQTSVSQNTSSPIPPAFQMASRTASRVKQEIARAATFTSEDFSFGHQDQEQAVLDVRKVPSLFPAAPPQSTFSEYSWVHQQAQSQIASNSSSYDQQQQQRSVNASFDGEESSQVQNDSFHRSSAPFGWAFIRLKHEVLLYRCPFHVQIGDHVVMEGDRGENMGRVERVVSEPPAHPVPCAILRYADEEDMKVIDFQRTKEEAAKHFAQGVADALNLHIKIVDTEFQSDGNKLTVYFSSRRMIDFRQLQRQLFKQYRCRIWLVNWADVVKNQNY